MRRDAEVLEQRRREAIRLLRKGKNQSEVARQFGVSRAAVSKWWKTYRKKGVNGLESTPHTGRPPKITKKTLRRVPRILLKGAPAYGYSTDIWTTQRIAEVIERELGVRYHPGHVWKIMHALGWTCQKPQSVALQRDDEAIREWKQKTWPRLQKKGVPRAGC